MENGSERPTSDVLLSYFYPFHASWRVISAGTHRWTERGYTNATRLGLVRLLADARIGSAGTGEGTIPAGLTLTTRVPFAVQLGQVHRRPLHTRWMLRTLASAAVDVICVHGHDVGDAVLAGAQHAVVAELDPAHVRCQADAQRLL